MYYNYFLTLGVWKDNHFNLGMTGKGTLFIRNCPMKVCLISIGFMVLSVSLSAVLVTVNPDDFAAGTDISTVSPYVTLSSGGGGSGLDGKVYTAVRTPAPA
jgi:hypothetical protein